ncbi:hypothetical protein MYX82_02040 [Acidobacteria bacterium AH-259-D05]|nr:hypothetical protein [Acidobacteria bacterium AH-259-D05]
MTAVLVAFLIVFVQMGANCAICHDLMSAESDKNSLVLASELASPSCNLSNCGLLCQVTSQEKPFSLPKSTHRTVVNLFKVAPALKPQVAESSFFTPLLPSSAAKEPHKLGVKVYLLNTSFLI